jgi:peroxin-16
MVSIVDVVMAFHRYGRSSFKPWLISLVMELASFSTTVDFNTKGFKSELTILDKQEMKSRFWLLVYYLLKPPMYDSYTK